MGLIDTHSHLTFGEFEGRIDEILSNGEAQGVDAVITVGTTLDHSRAAVALTQRYPSRIYAAIGIHPHESQKASQDDLDLIDALWEHPQVVAIGEMGLDYHYDFADRTVQHRVFARLLSLASARAKPLVIHSREALDDTISLLIDHGFVNRPVVFHCFTGTAEEAARLAEHGWRISFTGIVTFPKSQWLWEIAKSYPAHQIMIETDSPYLSPHPIRNRRPNEPAYLAHIAAFLAKLRGVPLAEFAAQTAENTRRFFQLPTATK